MAALAAPATAAAGGNANCAGAIASRSGQPACVIDLLAGFGRLFGFLISNDGDIPGT